MAATIKPIEGRSVHQIQSGQVISEGLTSVVKELVENGLDAHATSIEVRFKNNGLDAIEVIDNGDGISPDNYESIALKHWTSKLSSYADLDSVTTFGFRGEALSSLCALSGVQITTALASEAPKGTRLEFESSGKLKSRSVAAAQRGTTVSVEDIFRSLPVRRKELERNIKREYTKVLGILQAYAGICVGVKFSVFNQPAKGRRTPVFSTKGNPTVRENISNVFGSKTLSALVPMNLKFEMKPTRKGFSQGGSTEEREVKIVGHISRPVVGEGRQAPDRQMFFVNGRPCVLPQVSRAINEVYKQFNVTQSPFIFADIQLDTNAYDVNVSPDKRTILLHDQAEMMESLKVALTDLFDNHDQTIPASQAGSQFKTQPYRQLTIDRSSPPAAASTPIADRHKAGGIAEDESDGEVLGDAPDVAQILSSSPARAPTIASLSLGQSPASRPRDKSSSENNLGDLTEDLQEDIGGAIALPPPFSQVLPAARSTLKSVRNPCRSPRREKQGQATITIGDRSPVTAGRSPPRSPSKRRKVSHQPSRGWVRKQDNSGFSGALSRFAAPGTAVQPQAERGSESPEGENAIEKGDEIWGGMGGVGVRSQGGGSREESIDEQSDEVTYVGEAVSTESPQNPLFLRNTGLAEESDEDEENEPAGDVEDGDEDYVGEEENRKQSAIQAQILLEEAEEKSEEPASDSLERAFHLLSDSSKQSVKQTFRFVSTSLDKLREQAKDHPRSLTTAASSPSATGRSGIDFDEQDDAAEERLNLTVSKQDFLEMKVKGQFNRGFILATRADDLFIIDQHASDEKYNFEKLQQETVVQNQQLVVPKALDLMAMDEIIVTDNLEIFRKNGFIIEADPDGPVGNRCKLVSLPMSKETVFGLQDLEELIHLVHLDPGNSVTRCSKIRKMFAMRACRKSVMVGKALPLKAMEGIVRHMGELDKPWNCPHGRPTMRHLANLSQLKRYWGPDNKEQSDLHWESESWAESLSMLASSEAIE